MEDAPLENLYRLAASLSIALLLIATSSCSKPTPETVPPSGLIGDFASYQSFEDVRRVLEEKGLSWESLEDSQLAPRDRRPRFDIRSVVVKDFSDVNSIGELTMTFFNSRLVETRYFPTDFDQYLRALTANGLDLKKNEVISVAPNTRVWIGRDYRGRRYVAWEDVRLAAEMQEWIERYASNEADRRPALRLLWGALSRSPDGPALRSSERMVASGLSMSRVG